MIFSTDLFVFLFLPVFLAIYYVTPWRGKSYVILAASYLFYGWWRYEYLLLIFAMSTLSFYTAKIAHHGSTRRMRLGAMWFGIGCDLGALLYFKYCNFFVDNVNGILTFSGSEHWDVARVLLPIGISFHTFQSISYVIDVYRGDAPPARRLVDFLAFGALFPQLIAGPVLRYKDLADQFVSRTHSPELVTRGVYRFLLGLAMKVLVADTLAPLADRIFALPAPTLWESWLGALAYSFQLFFDFAGYSGMAIGLGLMMGFHFIENFDRPYISRSITEFWQRWHISLSTWLRDYLYIPLGGNRHGKVRTYVNLMLTMLLGGFWHGANWTFLLWGAWHGGLMAFERALGAKGRKSIWPAAVALPLTFCLVVIGWVMFRASSVSAAFSMYAGMIGLNGIAITPEIGWQIQRSEILVLVLAMGLCLLPRGLKLADIRIHPALQSLTYSLLFIVTLSRMVAQSFSPFLYFQF
ncbi:MBOAT family O-acyltransferase [Phaeovulum sp. W22_SRMD_FR3]|uniref:MBOAT family O-acyltransferase n=1 Tax=Phaeovulum sp. W22_SRMD_FR3 TaxID=3240274 RepID=UPI003F98CE4B